MLADDPSLETDATDPGPANDRRSAVAALVGSDATVLLVGCGSGGLAERLIDAGCQVTGVDDVDRLDAATRGRLKDFVVRDVAVTSLMESFDPDSFDVVVIDRVLQRLVDPARLVGEARTLLAPGGSLVISVPNAAHAAARLSMLRGTDRAEGAHRFTADALPAFVEQADLTIEDYQATMHDPLDAAAGGADLRPELLPPGVVEWVRHQPDALCVDLIVKAVPAEAGDGAGPRRPTPLRPVDATRRSDEYTEQRLLQQRGEHAMLVQRDHLLGLEAQTAAAAAYQRVAEDRAIRLATRAKRLKRQLVDLATAVDKMPRGRGQRQVRLLADQVRPGRGTDD